MKFTPRPYQLAMQEHIWSHDRCALFVPMGMGKTSATLHALMGLDAIGETPWPALVLAPKRVALTTWPEEVEKWSTGLKTSCVLGDAGTRRAALNQSAELYTINYDNLVWLVEQLGDRWPFRTVIADESTRLKGFRLKQGGQRAGALGRFAASPNTHRWINLTGTPSPNGLKDLWGQMWFLDGGRRLGRSFSAFESRWFRRRGKANQFGNIEPMPFSDEQIHDAIRDLCFSLKAEDWFDLPELVVNNIYVDLPPKARALYKQLQREMYLRLEKGEVEAFNAASLTNKCLQLANGAAYLDGSTDKWEVVHDAKIEALQSVVEEAAGAPVLVAYNFKSDLARLQGAFPRSRTLDANPRTISDWNAGRIPILFAHPASAGHGLNLQDGGNIIAFFGHNWNLEEYQQIIERIGPTRQAQSGHPRPVFVHHILTRGTVDELVVARRQTKREVQDLLLEAMKCSTDRT